MRDETGRWWSKHKFAGASLSISLAELVIIEGMGAFVQISKQPPAHLMLRLAACTVLVGGFGSLGFAIAGLVAESDRTAAILAMLVAVAVSMFCGSQVAD
jgi:hypothetical protein